MDEELEKKLKEFDRKCQKDMSEACCINGDSTCDCFHFCTLSGDQIDSIFS